MKLINDGKNQNKLFRFHKKWNPHFTYLIRKEIGIVPSPILPGTIWWQIPVKRGDFALWPLGDISPILEIEFYQGISPSPVGSTRCGFTSEDALPKWGGHLHH